MMLSPEEVTLLAHIARGAGKRILPYFRGQLGVRTKADHSPVTDADMASHDYLVDALQKHFPAIPVISEEDPAPPALDHESPYFLVDPLDGTKSFIRGEDEFTVNIGLVVHRRARVGIIGVPVSDIVYAGAAHIPPWRMERNGSIHLLHCRAALPDGVVVTRSRSHPSSATATFLETLNIREVRPASGAVKFCWVAEGSADVYPRFGPTMEWDTAAGQAILEAAGGRVETIHGGPLVYGKANFENPGFIAWGR